MRKNSKTKETRVSLKNRNDWNGLCSLFVLDDLYMDDMLEDKF